MTPAALTAAIRAVSPATPMHLAIAIANAALGYGRAYSVPPEFIAARLMRLTATRTEHITDLARIIASGKDTRLATMNSLAKKLRAAAATYAGPKYGAE